MSTSQINLFLLQGDFSHHLITAIRSQLGQAFFQLLTTLVWYYFLIPSTVPEIPGLLSCLVRETYFLSDAFKPISMVVHMCDSRWEAEADEGG